ncbi:hypothetical protein COV18_07410 [Candidatus Woesearchaeota archaeon CG10_big_fil_rev_8_21_14_0_10_37_12]|nr:MAG: hypothetical protein COV18_07410 [Candidatus Woesearchaeota archaeon CG10_big_fil_rev_8_21_14_0_10_37_12]
MKHLAYSITLVASLTYAGCASITGRVYGTYSVPEDVAIAAQEIRDKCYKGHSIDVILRLYDENNSGDLDRSEQRSVLEDAKKSE